MRLFALTTTILALIASAAVAQVGYPSYPFITWMRGYALQSNEWANDVLTTADGGYIVLIVAKTQSGDHDTYLRKLNSAGDIVWTYSMASQYYDLVGYSLCSTSDGGFAMAGSYTLQYNNTNMIVYKFGPNLNYEWSSEYGTADDEGAYAIQQTAEGGYILAGWKDYGADNAIDLFLAKVTAGPGSYPTWYRRYGGPFNDYGYSVRQAADGGYIIGGTYGGNGAQEEPDQYLIKTDTLGLEQWHRTFHDAFDAEGDEALRAVFQSPDNNFLGFGYTSTFIPDGCMFVNLGRKVLSTGSDCWEMSYTAHTRIFNGAQTSDGHYIAVGVNCYYHSPYTGGGEAYLQLVNGCGSSDWVLTFGGETYDVGTSGRETSDGGYVVVGYTEFEGGSRQSFAAKIVPQDSYICGDVNDNGVVNILDATYLINYLYKGGPAPAHPASADVNCDGVLNLLDSSYIINYLYYGGPAPCTVCHS